MKHLLLLLLCLQTLGANAQITTRTVAKEIEPPVAASYDSTRNFVGKNPKVYIGQRLYVLPKSQALRQFGYDSFVTDYKKSTLANKENTYQCCDSYGSKYEALQGQYFDVVAIIPHPKAAESSHFYENKCFLQLKPKDGGQDIYFEYDSRYEHAFPFLVVGFFEKQKRQRVGSIFILRGRNWVSNKELVPSDISSGLPVSQFEPGTEWKCVDVSVEERFFNPSLILQNSKNEQLALPLRHIINADYYFAFPASLASIYQKRFGPDIWSAIIAGKTRIGMTKEQAELAWGKPDSINKLISTTGQSEQWVYKSAGYLHFNNDKLTSIQ